MSRGDTSGVITNGVDFRDCKKCGKESPAGGWSPKYLARADRLRYGCNRCGYTWNGPVCN